MNILSVVEVATLTDLRPLTNYTISVLVLNSVGPSDPVSITERTDSERKWKRPKVGAVQVVKVYMFTPILDCS